MERIARLQARDQDKLRCYVGQIARFCGRAATANERELRAAARVLSIDAPRTLGRIITTSPASFPEIGREPFNVSPEELRELWERES